MTKNDRIKQIALDGTIRQNPAFKLALGTCPTLALTTTAMGSFGMGVAVTLVLTFSNLIISLLRNIIPDRVRIPCYILIIATLVTLTRMLIFAYVPDIYDTLGAFLPLIVVNCILLGRAEGFASQNPVGYSVLDGASMGVGYMISIVLMGAFREILGSAMIFGVELPWEFKIEFFVKPAGAFLTYGLFIALFTLCYNAVESKLRHKHFESKEATV